MPSTGFNVLIKSFSSCASFNLLSNLINFVLIIIITFKVYQMV